MLSFRIVLHLWLFHFVLGGSRRPPRLIGGLTIDDDERAKSPLKVLQYFVWIGNAWDCYTRDSFWRWLRDEPCEPEYPANLRCGGTLIMPRIVQTACHCLADFVERPGSQWGGYTVRTRLENSFFLYMGQSKVSGFRYPAVSEKFFVHSACAEVQAAPYFYRYDVGWIRTEEPIPYSTGVTKGIWSKLDYAGPYPKADLESFYLRVLGERHVCLGVGYGVEDKRELPGSTFKFGWVQVLDWVNCYHVMWKSRGLDRFASYVESDSWTCYVPLANPYAPPYLGVLHHSGDSGSPVTCDNNYFAVHSSGYGKQFNDTGHVPHAGFTNFSYGIPIKFIPEFNSVELRLHFEAKLLSASTSSVDVREDLRALELPKEALVQLKHRSFDMAVSSSGRRLHSALTFCLVLLRP